MRGWPAPHPRTLVGRSLNPQRNHIIGQSQSNKDRDLAIILQVARPNKAGPCLCPCSSASGEGDWEGLGLR